VLDPLEVFREYAADRRHLRLNGFQQELFPHLVRYTPSSEGVEGFVTFAELPPEKEVESIREQVLFFANRQEAFEWKVYDLDRPGNLRLQLEREGFTAGPAEAFMVLPLDGLQVSRPRVAEGVRLERVRDEDTVRHVVAVQAEVWQRDFSWLVDRLSCTLAEHPEEVSIYCAYSGERAIGTGWTEFPVGSRFAELHGGAVLAGERCLGIYSLLFHERLQEALHRGYHYLAVDAAPMSRPILERKGFMHVSNTYPMRKAAPSHVLSARQT
jgi:hypothetical protein